jgi:acyl carrier protein
VEDKEIIVLDGIGNDVGCDQVGEIAVRSSYLSPGYWRRPQLTEARFLPDPEGGDKLMFLTGDLGLLLSDGCLIYRGRKDFRVKVRGYTVEIAEIENALLNHPRIRDAGVIAWERDGENYLIAYVVPRQLPAPAIDELRNFLTIKLPDYMLPSGFVFLDVLPRTNGKLDRKALPPPEGQRPDLRQPYVAPQSEVEQKLVEIWEEVLMVRPIGIHDTFFDLGGHSLLAMQIIAKLYEALGDNISLRSFLDAPTVAGLAQAIETFRWTARNTDALPSDSANEEDAGEL